MEQNNDICPFAGLKRDYLVPVKVTQPDGSESFSYMKQSAIDRIAASAKERDLEFVRAYIAKHVSLLGDKGCNTKTSIQMKLAHLGDIDQEIMGPERWFTDEEMGKGKKLPGKTIRLSGGLNKDPVTIFVYGFIRDNLELFRKQ